MAAFLCTAARFSCQLVGYIVITFGSKKQFFQNISCKPWPVRIKFGKHAQIEGKTTFKKFWERVRSGPMRAQKRIKDVRFDGLNDVSYIFGVKQTKT